MEAGRRFERPALPMWRLIPLAERKSPDQGPGFSTLLSVMSRSFVLFGLFLARRESLQAFQQFFLRHALDGDLGIVRIDACPG